MRKLSMVFGAAVTLLLLGVINQVIGAAVISDNTNVAAPADNGTSTLLNVTTRMQQYVGFFGNVSAEVRLNVTVNSGTLYRKDVDRGKIYFFDTGATPAVPFVPALNNSETDGNFSLTGYYVTGNHFIHNSTVCGVASVDHLNTSDDYMVGIFRDAAATPNYFLCTDIRPVTSSNGFGAVEFEAVVPKTGLYMAYDVWIDFE